MATNGGDTEAHSAIPNTQKAWSIIAQGLPSQALKLDTSATTPSTLKKGEVLVKVEAAALNPVGYKFMRYPNWLVRRPWLAAENDLTGVVVSVHQSVNTLKVGDRVFGFLDVGEQIATKQGALCQYTRISASNLAIRPDNITPVEAAGLSLAGLTAWQAMTTWTELKPGTVVFVQGGSSSVGAFAIQIAKGHGCVVWASASRKNEDFVRGIGADEFLDYTAGDIPTQLSSHPTHPVFDLIFDAVGAIDPTLYRRSSTYLKSRGTFVSTLTPLSWNEYGTLIGRIWVGMVPRWLGGGTRRWRLVAIQHDRARLEAFRNRIAAGQVKPVIDSVYAFDDVLQAYDRIMTGRARGKVVIRVDPHAL